jgi:hypothetical protein
MRTKSHHRRGDANKRAESRIAYGGQMGTGWGEPVQYTYETR